MTPLVSPETLLTFSFIVTSSGKDLPSVSSHALRVVSIGNKPYIDPNSVSRKAALNAEKVGGKAPLNGS